MGVVSYRYDAFGNIISKVGTGENNLLFSSKRFDASTELSYFGARQGMIIFVPEGNDEDITRKTEFYDSRFNYLKEIGLPSI